MDRIQIINQIYSDSVDVCEIGINVKKQKKIWVFRFRQHFSNRFCQFSFVKKVELQHHNNNLSTLMKYI
jgi:hypothetical protein